MPEPISSTSSFRRFLLRILLPLIAIISGAGLLFSYLFEQQIIFKSQSGGAYKVNRILNETHPGEIPIFGSSRAEGCILPDSLGPNYFNYGLSGTKYDVTLFFLRQECTKTKTTPWIILNLDLDGLLHGLGDIGNYIPNSNNPAVRSLMGREYQPWFSLPFIRYYGRFEGYVRAYLGSRIELTKVTDKGASIEKNILPQKEFDLLVSERRKWANEFTCDAALQQELFAIIAANTGRRFVFIVSPYHNSLFDKFKNPGDVAQFLAGLRSYKNVNVFDFSRLPLSDSMFLNTSHINFKGAVVFNRQLRDSLNSIGVH